MKVEVERLGRIFEPKSSLCDNVNLTHTANPVLVPKSRDVYRMFFNSRDSLQRSSVFSVDLNLQEMILIEGSFREQFVLSDEKSYFRDGISLGSTFHINCETWIGFMAWINPPKRHWFGTIGKFKLDENLNITNIEDKPWFDLDSIDPVSLSYPAFYKNRGKLRMWYGSTITWDAGNGEMLHVLKEKSSLDGNDFQNTGRFIQWQMNTSQAFSRPSIIQTQNIFLMAYSVRGNQDKYRIEFSIIDNVDSAEEIEILHVGKFSNSGWDWESEMVEYPFLVSHEQNIYMFYNGNGYGRTGIGVAQISIT